MTNCPCRDCGIDTLPAEEDARAEWYMVHDHLWTQAGMAEDGGYLCIGCLERRLGRRLLPDDFTDAPVNDPGRRARRWAWSYRTRRLRDRLFGRGLVPLPDPPGQGRLF